MRKRIRSLVVALALLLVPSGGQTGNGDQTIGRIATIDGAQHAIVLTNGKSYFCHDADLLLGLRPGDHVAIAYDKSRAAVIAIEVLNAEDKNS